MEKQKDFASPFIFHPPEDFQGFLSSLISKYNPAQLICIGDFTDTQTIHSSFNPFAKQQVRHIFILLVAKNEPPREKRLQDWVNKKYKSSKITIITEEGATILSDVSCPVSFANMIYHRGTVLYTAEDFSIVEWLEKTSFEPPADRLTLRISGAYSHINLANQFCDGARLCLKSELYGISTFMFSESLQQYCLALIALNLDYFPKMHNPMRLMDMCKLFTFELIKFFQLQAEEDHRLSSCLQDIHKMIRYGDDEYPDEGISIELDRLFYNFNEIVNELYDIKSDELELLIEHYGKSKLTKTK